MCVFVCVCVCVCVRACGVGLIKREVIVWLGWLRHFSQLRGKGYRSGYN